MFLLQSQITSLSKLMILVILTLFALGLCNYSQAAELQITSSADSYSIGQTFVVTVQLAALVESVDAVEAVLVFDKSLLSVVGINEEDSALSHWTTRPTFSNNTGVIKFAGRSQAPLIEESTLLRIIFRAIEAGKGSIVTTGASIFTAGNNYVDVFRSGDKNVYSVIISSSSTTSLDIDKIDTATKIDNPPQAPVVFSDTFFDSETWSQTSEGIFRWLLPSDVDAVAVEIATSTDNIPQDNTEAIYEPAINEFDISDLLLDDGVYYLSVIYRNEFGWGQVLNKIIKIDTTPPEPFRIDVRPTNPSTGFPIINFITTDNTSGISYYDLYIGDKEPIRISPDEAYSGYILSELEDGTYLIRVVAVDKAANERESKASVVISGGWINPEEQLNSGLIKNLFTTFNIYLAFSLLIIGGLLIYTHSYKKWVKIREEKLYRETRDIQNQMEKIFSALRDEIYDQIDTISNRNKLSKREKQAVDGLNNALEISEALIEKEINDVKSIIR